MQIRLEDNNSTINNLHDLGDDLKVDFLKEFASKVYDESLRRIKPHTKTGRLERNLKLTIHGKRAEISILNQGMITSSGINYAIFVHFGTKPHIIKPENSKALRWQSNGFSHFAKKVKHPGYKGDPFLYDALDVIDSKTNSLFMKFIKDRDFE